MVAENTLVCDHRSASDLGSHCKAVGSLMPQAPETIGNVGRQVEGPGSMEINKSQEMCHVSLEVPRVLSEQ